MVKYDVCIVGAGLSGLAALHTLSNESLRVAIVDDRSEIGGNFLKRKWLLDEPERFNWLVEKEISDSVDVYLNHEAIGVYADESLGITDQLSLKQIQAEVYLQCTGLRELPYLFDGWQLPGVITLDAFLQLRLIEQVNFPHHIGIVGQNPLLEIAADKLASEGFNLIRTTTEQSVQTVGNKQVEYLMLDGEPYPVDIVITSKGYIPVNELAHLYKKPDAFDYRPQNHPMTLSERIYRAGQSAAVTTPELSIQSGQRVAKEIISNLQKEGV
nr:FAD-dependent oxidoreductase [Allobacillus halotolerans]